MKQELHKLGLKAVFIACLSMAILTPKLDSIYLKTKKFFAQNHSTYTKVAAENYVIQHKEKRIQELSELFSNLQLVANTLPTVKKIEIKLLGIFNYFGANNSSKIIEILDWVIDLSDILNRIIKNLSKIRNNGYVPFNNTQEKIYHYIAKNSVSIISISRELKNIKREKFITTDLNLSCEKFFSDNEKLAISSLSNSLKG